MHVELYDKKGTSLVPVPEDALEVLLMHGLHAKATESKSLTQSRRALKDAIDTVTRALNELHHRQAVGVPGMERLF